MSYKINFKLLKMMKEKGHCLCDTNQTCPCNEFLEKKECKCGVFKKFNKDSHSQKEYEDKIKEGFKSLSDEIEEYPLNEPRIKVSKVKEFIEKDLVITRRFIWDLLKNLSDLKGLNLSDFWIEKQIEKLYDKKKEEAGPELIKKENK